MDSGLIYTLLVGLIGGWLANSVYQGKGNGLIINTCVGVVGSYIGYALLRYIQPDAKFGIFGDVVVSFVGSLLFVWFIGLFRSKK